jgi:hypothetical protein
MLSHRLKCRDRGWKCVSSEPIIRIAASVPATLNLPGRTINPAVIRSDSSRMSRDDHGAFNRRPSTAVRLIEPHSGVVRAGDHCLEGVPGTVPRHEQRGWQVREGNSLRETMTRMTRSFDSLSLRETRSNARLFLIRAISPIQFAPIAHFVSVFSSDIDSSFTDGRDSDSH